MRRKPKKMDTQLPTATGPSQVMNPDDAGRMAPRPAAKPALRPQPAERQLRPQPVEHAPRPQPAEHRLAVIGKSVHVKGELISDEDITIDGTVDGTVALNGHNLTVGPNGRITAEINANSVVVEGHVVGNINAKERIELRAGSSVEGDLAAPRVVLGEGARLKGSVDMQIESGSVSGTWQAVEPTPQSAVTAPPEPVSDELFSDSLPEVEPVSVTTELGEEDEDKKSLEDIFD
jgi:cytoskeletal protein CcmA (bactofilin family)